MAAVIILVLVACVAAYVLSRWLTRLSRDWALKHNIVSLVNHRSSHSVPTARLGGVGLALGFGVVAVLFLAAFQLLATRLHLRPPFSEDPIDWSMVHHILFLFAGWLLFLAVGLLDDLYDLPPLLKLGLSVIAAVVSMVVPILGGVTFGIEHSWVLKIGLSLFWILFFVNAFNFMDGMDGFAAGFARLAALFLFVIHLAYHNMALGDFTGWEYGGVLFLLLPILAAACCGFLYWNNPPAKVFMGDGGSLSLGYLLAVYVIVGGWGIESFLIKPRIINGRSYRDVFDVFLPQLSALTVLLPFIFDVILTLVRRSLRGENILKAHREHLYQRLMKTGLSHAEVLRITKRTFWACGGLALAGALFKGAAAQWIALALALGVMLGYWRFTLARERVAATRPLGP